MFCGYPVNIVGVLTVNTKKGNESKFSCQKYNDFQTESRFCFELLDFFL